MASPAGEPLSHTCMHRPSGPGFRQLDDGDGDGAGGAEGGGVDGGGAEVVPDGGEDEELDGDGSGDGSGEGAGEGAAGY